MIALNRKKLQQRIVIISLIVATIIITGIFVVSNIMKLDNFRNVCTKNITENQNLYGINDVIVSIETISSYRLKLIVRSTTFDSLETYYKLSFLQYLEKIHDVNYNFIISQCCVESNGNTYTLVGDILEKNGESIDYLKKNNTNNTTYDNANESADLPKNAISLYYEGSVILCAVSKNDYSQAINCIINNDEAYLDGMILSGLVFDVPSNTKAVLVQAGFGSAQVRILEGIHKNEKVWVASEAVSGK